MNQTIHWRWLLETGDPRGVLLPGLMSRNSSASQDEMAGQRTDESFYLLRHIIYSKRQFGNGNRYVLLG